MVDLVHCLEHCFGRKGRSLFCFFFFSSIAVQISGSGISNLLAVATTFTGRSDSEHETDENEIGSESDQHKNKDATEDDEEKNEEEFVKTPFDHTPTDDEDETNVESNVDEKAEGDEDEEMDYTTSLLYDDIDIRRIDPVRTDEWFVQQEGTEKEMINS
nr:hypothetical protein [Tanacetum cinerariifolium]